MSPITTPFISQCHPAMNILFLVTWIKIVQNLIKLRPKWQFLASKSWIYPCRSALHSSFKNSERRLYLDPLLLGTTPGALNLPIPLKKSAQLSMLRGEKRDLIKLRYDRITCEEHMVWQ